MNSIALEDFQWLLTSDAAKLLEFAQAQFVEAANVVRIAKHLRKQTTAARSAIIMEQAQLRLKAKTKFTQADEMLFTRRGLEQATSEPLARYKVKRFEGIGSVADICCGIGGDLLGLLNRDGARRTLGIDVDPVATLFAKHNCFVQKRGLDSTFEIVQSDFNSFPIEEWEGVHCDPDRRVNERTVLGSRFSPPLSSIFSRIQPQQKLAIKVAPATPIADGWPEGIEREWIGDRRECKQQVIYAGPLNQRVEGRTATVIDGSKVNQLFGDDHSTELTIEISNKIKTYLYEPHPTVLAAGLTGELASQCGVARMAADIDYLTSSKRQLHPMMTTFEVVESFPLNLKKVFDFLKSRSVGQIEVKNRGGAKLIFEKLQRLKLKGEFRATVILTRIGLQQWVAISRRSPTDFPV